MTELNDVEKSGKEIRICDSTKKYYASIAQVVGDNLGIHQIFGIKQCFRGENICHLCNA